MSANRDPAGGGTERADRAWTTDGETAPAAGTPPRLASTLVTYPDRPDRRTVYPPGLSGVARMATWFTADDDAFVDPKKMR